MSILLREYFSYDNLLKEILNWSGSKLIILFPVDLQNTLEMSFLLGNLYLQFSNWREGKIIERNEARMEKFRWGQLSGRVFMPPVRATWPVSYTRVTDTLLYEPSFFPVFQLIILSSSCFCHFESRILENFSIDVLKDSKYTTLVLTFFKKLQFLNSLWNKTATNWNMIIMPTMINDVYIGHSEFMCVTNSS